MQAGTTIQNYEVIRQIGVGGMGEVWLGKHKLIGREVAIKSLHRQLVLKESIRKRFKNEAATLARLQHPNVVALLDYHEDENGVYLIMEYVEGMPLDEYIDQKSGPIPEPLLSQLFAQILAGVSYAHRKKIVHRDIKPSNFLITPDNTIKILDFGIAKLLDQSDQKLTKTGTAIGTVLYMSPEQVKGEKVDHRSDIYSLGVTLFQMATGQCPYDKFTTEFHVYDKIVNHALPPARSIYPGVTPPIQSLIQQATEKNPDQRFQSSADFLKALGAQMQGSGSGLNKGGVVTPPPAPGNRVVPPPAPGNRVVPPTGNSPVPPPANRVVPPPANSVSPPPANSSVPPPSNPLTPPTVPTPPSNSHSGHSHSSHPRTEEELPVFDDSPVEPVPQNEEGTRKSKKSGQNAAASHPNSDSADAPPAKPRKKRRLVLILLAILVLGGAGTTIALLTGGNSKTEKLYVIASNLFLRTAPSTESRTQVKLPYGTEVEVTGRPNKDWVEISHNGKKRYLATDYLRDRDAYYELNFIFTNSEGKELLDGSYHKLALQTYFTKMGYRVNMPTPDYERIYGKEKSNWDIWEVQAFASSSPLNTAIPSIKLEKDRWKKGETRNSVVIVNNKANPDNRKLVAFRHTDNGNNEIGTLDISNDPDCYIVAVNESNFFFIGGPYDNNKINREMQNGKEGILLAKSANSSSGKLVLWEGGKLKSYSLPYCQYIP